MSTHTRATGLFASEWLDIWSETSTSLVGVRLVGLVGQRLAGALAGIHRGVVQVHCAKCTVSWRVCQAPCPSSPVVVLPFAC
jgi:hypothetical protein